MKVLVASEIPSITVRVALARSTLSRYYIIIIIIIISLVKFPMKTKMMFKKVAKFVQMLGILKNNIKPTLVKKFSKIKIYNALAPPILLYGGEIWNPRK
jgi:hypothetical protein